ncbi:MAG: nitrogen fixation protein NifE [Oscillospiraceae bacterium]|nr:nitrogen fixation protein NifE [Oscillospiraceae bacterium]
MAADPFRHLNRLSAVRSDKNIKFLTPAVYSGGWCPMRVVCNICEEIEGISYLMVGMPECTTHSRPINSGPTGPNGELRWLYVLDEKEVIFGCRKGVMDALRQMDAAGARAIMMIATCVTDLIGEDFDSIIEEIQPELNARLSYVTMGQFKNFGSPIGTWKTAEAIGAYMQPRERIEKSANILFMEPWHTPGTRIEYPLIVGALERRGIALRSFAAGATLDDFLAAPSAALNLVTTAYTQPLAAQMQKRFGVPYVPLHSAFSVEEVDRAYAMIEEELGVDLSGEFDAWRDKAVELEERAHRELPGLRYALMTYVDMPVALAKYLSEFGMEPLLLDVQDFHREDALYARVLKERGFDPPVCHIMYRDRDVLLIRDLKPDICFGYISEPVEGLKVAEEMGDFFGITGYERIVGILSRIFTVLETGKTGERLDIYGPVPV